MALTVIAALLSARSTLFRRPLVPMKVSLQPREILADGYNTSTLTINADTDDRPQISVDLQRRIVVQSIRRTATGWQAQLRAGVLPGLAQLRIEMPGFIPALASVETLLDSSDELDDGTPDFLRLDDAGDEQSFRRWFTFLAEAQYFQPPQSRAAEITDCAALIRYAYREAIRQHDTAWAATAHLPLMPALESIAKYDYPHTAIGAALFRTRPGPFRPADLKNGAFAQFADAQTLYRFNTHFFTRDIAGAEPGDLLFFRQASDHMPFHSMIYLGASHISGGDTRYVLYHTGPTGADPGEMRRLTVSELLNFPQPQWRPTAGNPAFLGVYRWNILAKDL
jgi:uncharacterized protein YfaT (DUF1175 family)